VLGRVLFAAWFLLVACRQEVLPTRYDGLVVELRTASIVQIVGFTLRTDDGQLVEIVVEGDVGITASHLREHMTLADPVTVTVRHAAGLTIATRVLDLQPPASASESPGR
jgi:hypothetical protein